MDFDFEKQHKKIFDELELRLQTVSSHIWKVGAFIENGVHGFWKI